MEKPMVRLGREKDDFRVEQNLFSIMMLVINEGGSLSIAEIGRKLNLNRSTLRYYLTLLREKNRIRFDRQQNAPGRPTLVKANEAQLKKETEGFMKANKKYVKEQKASPYTKTILKTLSKKNEVVVDEILGETKKIGDQIYMSKTLNSLGFLQNRKLIKLFYRITKEGRKFLEENKK